MSWHYLPELVEGFSEESSSGGVLSAPLNGPRSPAKPSSGDSRMEHSPNFRSGTTCRPSTGDRGLDWWMSFLEDSPAKTSAPQERGLESTENAPECGNTWPGSLTKYDHVSRSWKTRRFSLGAGLDEFSETWPRWGSMRNGACWVRSTLGHRTGVTASGSWPTIRAQDGERGGRGDLIQAVRGNENTHFRLWHTPVADDAVNRARGKWNSRGEPQLSAEVLFPENPLKTKGSGKRTRLLNTPTANDAKNSTLPPASARRDSLVGDVLRNFPTPLVGGTGAASHNQISGRFREAMAPHLPEGGGGLNPEWVEWLMGWPIGWTAYEPLEMDRFQQWPQWHSGNCLDG